MSDNQGFHLTAALQNMPSLEANGSLATVAVQMRSSLLGLGFTGACDYGPKQSVQRFLLVNRAYLLNCVCAGCTPPKWYRPERVSAAPICFCFVTALTLSIVCFHFH
jgi:hypothetical protein